MKKGLLSERVSSLEESATLALNARAKQLQSQGRPIYNLTAGELDSATPAYIQEALKNRLDQNKYTPTSGLADLRQAIADYENNRLKTKFTPANIVATAGVKVGLYGLLQVLLDPGDEVIVPLPAWVSYAHMIELAGGKMVKVRLTKDFDLDPEAIATAITAKTKAVLINSPHNPTGAVFSKAALTKLAKILKNKAVVAISDEIYEKLIYDKPFTSIASVGLPAEQTIIVNSFSKSQALMGWRIGYAAAPIFIAEALNNFLSHATGNAPLPSQLAAIEALKLGNQPEALKTLTKRKQLVEKELAKIDRIKFTIPGGAFYFWLDISNITKDSNRWCEDLLDATGVALVPGEAFFAPGFARLSIAADEKILQEALKRIEQFAGEYNA